MKFALNFIALIFVATSSVFAQVTGLAGWNICLDPGHSGTENMGIYGYSEAERNVRVALRLREFLLSTTDIDTVYITRTNDQQSVSLSQRTDYANSVAAAWFHSVHSNAGAPERNNVLLLWGQYANGNEKIPNGGKAMSDIIVNILSRVMRIPSAGSWGDHTFYGGSPSYRPSPYLWINYYSSMPSELSESGYHTNPRQNQLFMNTDWKKFEARAFYWSILEFFEIERPDVGICTGILTDKETNTPINGAKITLNGQTYVTDTYESLFYKYTNDPDLLHNGFYYIENLPEGELEMIVDAPGYYSETSQVTISKNFFSFNDAKIISKMPPYVVSTTPSEGAINYPSWESIVINFSRPMDQASVEMALTITPPASGVFTWLNNGKQLKFTSDTLQFETNYSITISGNAKDIYGHPFDGNGDGIGGDDFTFSFKTGLPDMSPPRLLTIYPKQTASNVELLPIINITYDEELDSNSITEDLFKLERFVDKTAVNGILKNYVIGKQTVLCFFPGREALSR